MSTNPVGRPPKRKADGADSEFQSKFGRGGYPLKSGLPNGITFSAIDKSNPITLSKDMKSAWNAATKGYRMVKATAGVNEGCWFFEFIVPADLKPGAHLRLGWANELASRDGPVGYDQHGYGYRDEGGSRVHQSIRYTYGPSYGPGDIIGCMIDFNTPPADIAAAELKDAGASAGPKDGFRLQRAKEVAEAGGGREEVEKQLFNWSAPQRPSWAPPPAVPPSSGMPASSPSADSVSTARESTASSVGSTMLPTPLSTASAAATGKASVGAASKLGGPAGNPNNTKPVQGPSSAAGAAVGAGAGSASAPSAVQPSSSQSHSEQGPPNTKETVNQRHWGSSIRFFKNGQDCGIAFIQLTRAEKYYPAASLYMGAAVSINPGPVFRFPPQQSATAATSSSGDGAEITGGDQASAATEKHVVGRAYKPISDLESAAEEAFARHAAAAASEAAAEAAATGNHAEDEMIASFGQQRQQVRGVAASAAGSSGVGAGAAAAASSSSSASSSSAVPATAAGAGAGGGASAPGSAGGPPASFVGFHGIEYTEEQVEAFARASSSGGGGAGGGSGDADCMATSQLTTYSFKGTEFAFDPTQDAANKSGSGKRGSTGGAGAARKKAAAAAPAPSAGVVGSAAPAPARSKPGPKPGQGRRKSASAADAGTGVNAAVASTGTTPAAASGAVANAIVASTGEAVVGGATSTAASADGDASMNSGFAVFSG